MKDQTDGLEVLSPRAREDTRQPRVLTPIHYESAASANIGLICTNNDVVAERAYRSLIPECVELLTTRTVYLDDEPMEDGQYRQQTPFASIAAEFPEDLDLDVLAFSCTSGTVVTGPERIAEILRAARSEAQPTTPGIAALAALESLNCKRVALATPYDVTTHNLFVPFFADRGFEVVADGTFKQDNDLDISALSREAWFHAARSLTQDVGADVFYISCTASDVVDLIDELEAELGIPVVTSTQAMAWHTRVLLGLKDRGPRCGWLFEA